MLLTQSDSGYTPTDLIFSGIFVAAHSLKQFKIAPYKLGIYNFVRFPENQNNPYVLWASLHNSFNNYLHLRIKNAFVLRGLVVCVLATGPMELAAAGSGPAEDGGFLWVIKIRSAHFLRTGSKAVGPMS
jgi:hypothetical protein